MSDGVGAEHMGCDQMVSLPSLDSVAGAGCLRLMQRYQLEELAWGFEGAFQGKILPSVIYGVSDYLTVRWSMMGVGYIVSSV